MAILSLCTTKKWLAPLIFLGSVAHASSTESVNLTLSSAQIKLGQVKTLSNIPEYFPLSSSDRKIFLSDIKRLKIAEKPLPIIKIQGSQLVFIDASDQVAIDFKDISKSVFWIKNTKIDLSKKISYPNAKIIAEMALDKKSALFSVFVPKVQAFSNNFLITVLGSFISASAPKDSAFNRTLEQSILTEYESTARLLKPTKNLTMPVFFCKENSLEYVQQVTLIKENRILSGPQNQKTRKLTVLKDGFELAIPDWDSKDSPCIIKANEQGKVVDAGNNCYALREGDNVLDTLPFSRFTLSAIACCAKPECYEKVSAGLNKIKNDFISAESSSPTSSGGGTK